MKTDKELLQLAAKAVGIDGVYGSILKLVGSDWDMVTAIHTDGDGWWNPLSNDGEALRLAVDLEFDIAPMGYYVVVTDIGGHVTEQEYGNDKSAATRRAIVRAAAAIVEGME